MAFSVQHLSGKDCEEWNPFVAQEPSFGLLQSWEWGEFKEKLGWKAYRIAVKKEGQIIAGAQMLIKSVVPGVMSVAYVPRGPIGDWLDADIAPKLLDELHKVARQHKAVFLKIEPPLLNKPGFDQALREQHFRPSPYSNQPRATIILDLTHSLDDILKQMRKKTRQYIGGAVREGITVRIGQREDLPAFYDLMRATGKREHFPSRVRTYYEEEWQTFVRTGQTVLLMALQRGDLVAVRTAYYFGSRAAEFHAGSVSNRGNLHSNYILVWEAVKWAKEHGCCTYDLWGIPEEVGQTVSEGNEAPLSDRTDGLWGVYRFKTGFSKNIVFYVGAYDYVYNRLLYALMTNRFVNTNTLDRAAVWLDQLKRS